jgi:excisionase family DNA binding protein
MTEPNSTPWLTAVEAAARLRINRKTLYAEVRAGRCRAARIGGRRNLRFLPEWLDDYLTSTAEVVPITTIVDGRASVARRRAVT